MAKNLVSIKTLATGIILLLISLFPTGCAKTHYKHYEGPTLPDSELALIKASLIHSIDGHTHKYGTGGKDFAKALTTGLFSEDFGRTYYQIMPGEHEIEILLGRKARVKPTGGQEEHTVLHDFHWDKTAFFRMEFEKGHTYQIVKIQTPISQEEPGYITVGHVSFDFYFLDVCCLSRAPVKLKHGIVNRIEE